MNQNQAQQKIAIIRALLEKTRQDTAESGYFIISLGLFSMVAVLAVGLMERLHQEQFIVPVLLVVSVICGAGGYFAIVRQQRKAGVTSYSKTICYNVWLACAIPALLVTFLFPLLGVYPWRLVPALASLFMGIAVFSTGVIFEARFLIGSSAAWWGGAVLLVFLQGVPKMLIMLVVIFLGWVLPGMILNKKYRNRSTDHES